MSNYNRFEAKLNAVKKDKSKPYKIPVMSAKRKAEQKEYKKIVASKIKQDDRCKIKSEVCTGKAEGLDHLQKRSPSNMIAEDNLIQSCNACNLYKELNPTWAMNNGFSISRFKK